MKDASQTEDNPNSDESGLPWGWAVFAPFLVMLVLSVSFRVWAIFKAGDALDGARERAAKELKADPSLSDEQLSEKLFGPGSDETKNRQKLTRVLREWAQHCPPQEQATKETRGSNPSNSTSPAAPAASASATPEAAMHGSPATPSGNGTKSKGLDCNAEAARWRLIEGGLFADIGLQAALVLLFPGLFLAALHRLRHRSSQGKPSQGRYFATLRSDYLQREEQSRPHFFRRLCFAVLITMGAQYLLSPAGMIASAMGEFGSLTASPGESSMPFFVSHLMTSATPTICGFVGFYVYAVGDFWGRFATGTVNHLMFLQLFRRGIIVWLICLVIGSMVDNEVVNVVAFGLGCFPNMALSYAGKLFDGASGKLLAESPDQLGFRALPELDVLKQTALEEVGITSVHDLAHASWRQLVQKTGIQGTLLLHAADQALLIDVLGVEGAKKLSAVSVRTASELARFLAHPEHAEANLQKVKVALDVTDVSMLVERIEQSPNVAWVLKLRAKFPPREVRTRT